MSAMKNLLPDHITRARQGPAVAYAFDDEISLFSFGSPSDVDGHPLNIEGFRKWLTVRYSNIERLNRERGSRFFSFQEVQPSGFDRVSVVCRRPHCRPHIPVRGNIEGAVRGLVNERTGSKLGDGQDFEDDWRPREANIYSFEGRAETSIGR